ncbi:MAG: cytidylate kinase [Verrucomicrobia bacterium GWF2_62_7]|nr:MAG: cytidylate kinase [Verrucomicrobia bacterium GWF2_62_7]
MKSLQSESSVSKQSTARAVVIAIDGTSGSGKSTIAKALARHYGFVHVDTGAMYRAVTWHCLQHGADCNDAAAVVRAMREMKSDFRLCDGRIVMFINGADPGESLRSEAVTQNVSLVARIPEVRAWLVAQQRALLRFGSLVMEGRDIGSVVFPDTPFKFYVDADPAVRAARRASDGYADQVTQRDQLDTTRKVSPLVVSPGACLVDTGKNTPPQTLALVLAELKRRGL